MLLVINHNNNDSAKSTNHGIIIALIVSMLLIAGTAITLIVNNIQAVNYINNQVEDVLTDSAEMQSYNIESAIENQFALLNSIITMIDPHANDDFVKYTSRLSTVISKSHFDKIAIVSSDGTAYFNDNTKQNVSESAYYKKAAEGNRAVECIKNGNTIGTTSIYLSVPYINYEGEKFVIFGIADKTYIQDIIKLELYERRGYTYICDQNGNVIIESSNVNYITSSSNIFNVLDAVKYGNGYSAEKYLSNLKAGNSGTFNIDMGDERTRFVVFKPIENLNLYGHKWFIVNAIPGDIIEAEVTTQKNSGFILTAITTSFALCAIFLVVLREKQFRDVLNKETDHLRISIRESEIAIRRSEKAVGNYDFDGHILKISSSFATQNGLPDIMADIPNSLFDNDIIAEESIEDFKKFCNDMNSGIPDGLAILHIVTSKKDNIWLKITYDTIFDYRNNPLRAIIVLENVTRIREMEIAYEKWRQSIESIPYNKFALFEYNLTKDVSESTEGNLLDVKFIAEMDNFNNRTIYITNHYIYEEDKENYHLVMNREKLISAYYAGSYSFKSELRILDKNGSPIWIRLSIQLVGYSNSTDIKAYILFEDINETKLEELEIKQRSEEDPLTHLLNRSAFIEKINNILSVSSTENQHALFMIDIDNFKLVNDTLGHGAGDKVLVDIARYIRSVLRAKDLIARIGGDEFMIFLLDIPYETAIEKKARQICECIHRKIGDSVVISASIGISIYPKNGMIFEELYEKADIALYNVKQNNKNNLAFYYDSMTQKRNFEPGEISNENKNGNSGKLEKTKPLILLVDDDNVGREIIKDMLSEEFLIIEAKNGYEAMQHIRRYGDNISLILLDIIMPGIDGFDILRHIKENRKVNEVPIIIITNNDDEELEFHAIDLGAADFIRKPIDLRILKRRIVNLITINENTKLRIQNNYLKQQSEEENRYKYILNSAEIFVVEYDGGSETFKYDQYINEHVSGAYDDRSLWKILRDDSVAEISEIEKLREKFYLLVREQSLTRETLNIKLRAPNGDMRLYRAVIVRWQDELYTKNKYIITFTLQ